MMTEPESARNGKIARMPLAIRSEVNRRLLEGQSGSVILVWLNGHKDVLRVLDEQFGEEPVTPQNLSEWRRGGYRDWQKKHEEVERTRELAEYALQLGAAAGGDITDGSAAIAGGRIMAVLESAEGKDLSDAIFALAALRSGDLEKEKIKVRREAIAQRDRVVVLAEKKFQRDTVKMIMKYHEDEKVKSVLDARSSNKEKIDQLGKLIFKDAWE